MPWNNILISAGVAIFTTLLIEYAAKPLLERRKDRILEKDKRRRTSLFALGKVTNVANEMLVLKDGMDIAPLRRRLSRCADELDGLLDIADEGIRLPSHLGSQWVECFAIIWLTTATLDEKGTPNWRNFEEATRQLERLQTFLDTSRIRMWRRGRLKAKILATPVSVDNWQAPEPDGHELQTQPT